MKDLFITKSTIDYGLSSASGDIAGTWAVDLLVEGSIAFVDGDGTLIDDQTPSITTPDFGIMLGSVSGEGPKVLLSLDRERLTSQKLVYSAAVKATNFLGSDQTGGNANGFSLNLPSSINPGDTVGIYITDLSKAHEDITRLTYYAFTVITGDLLTGTGARNIIAKLVALINDDSDAIVVATAFNDGAGLNDGIRFVSKTAGIDFAVSHLGGNAITDTLGDAQIIRDLKVDGDYDATSTNCTNAEPAQGDYAFIAEMELAISSRDGNINSNLLNQFMYSASKRAISGITYTLFTLTIQKHDDSILVKEANVTQTIYIACPSGDTGTGESIDAIDNILDVL